MGGLIGRREGDGWVFTSVLVCAVAVPAFCCWAVSLSQQDARLPGVDCVVDLGGEVVAAVDDPTDARGEWWWREETGTDGAICARSPNNVQPRCLVGI